MGEFKHLVIVKFKEGADVEELMKGMEELVSGIDLVKSFKWGHDTGGQEMLKQGFTHAFLMTFRSKEDYGSFASNSKHLEFSSKFSVVIDKVIVLDFPSVVVNAAAV